MTRREADAIELSGVEPFYQDIARDPTEDDMRRLALFAAVYDLVLDRGEADALAHLARLVSNAGRFQRGA